MLQKPGVISPNGESPRATSLIRYRKARETLEKLLTLSIGTRRTRPRSPQILSWSFPQHRGDCCAHWQRGDAGGYCAFKSDFESANAEAVPEELMVWAGEFYVKEIDGNKALVLPGTPLQSNPDRLPASESQKEPQHCRSRHGSKTGRHRPSDAQKSRALSLCRAGDHS